jgi:hypothetical protein
MENIMTYPLAHKIIKRFPYTTAANTNIRDTFAKARATQQKGNEHVTTDQLPQMARVRVPAA